jgi:hypothetical protein
MTNVPFYDIVFYSAIAPALLLVLVVVVFVELRRVRRTVNETNGLYKVMLDYVLEANAPDKSEDADDDPPSLLRCLPRSGRRMMSLSVRLAGTRDHPLR